MTTHSEAKAILERAVPGIDPATSLLVRGISMIEAQYGDGWGHGLSTAGQGSNNWGAMTAGSSWTGPTFEHQDSRWDENLQKQVPYVTKYRSYATPEDGARDLYRALTGYHGIAAELAKAGRWGEISKAIGPRGTYYYGGKGPPAEAEVDHQRRFLAALDDIQRATGEHLYPGPSSSSSSPSFSSSSSSSTGAGVVLLLIGSYLFWQVFRRR